jgi:hypothetical protein
MRRTPRKECLVDWWSGRLVTCAARVRRAVCHFSYQAHRHPDTRHPAAGAAQKNSPGGRLDLSPDCVPPGISASKKRRRPGAKVCIGRAGFNALAILADCENRDDGLPDFPSLPPLVEKGPQTGFDSSTLPIKPIFRTIGSNPPAIVRAHRGNLGKCVECFSHCRYCWHEPIAGFTHC